MNLIKEYRLKRGWTQYQLANIVNKSIGTIQAIEQNIRRPSIGLTMELFKKLKIPNTKLNFFLSSYLTKCKNKKH